MGSKEAELYENFLDTLIEVIISITFDRLFSFTTPYFEKMPSSQKQHRPPI